jgi:hypothetical protein
VAALPAHLVQFERFENCRHAVMTDEPERTLAVIRDFIATPIKNPVKTKPAPKGAGD